MTESTLSGIKKIVMGAIISEYGALQVISDTHADLKYRVRKLINSSQEVQSYFKNHRNANKIHREEFKDAMNNGATVLLAEIVDLLYGLSEEDLEVVLESLKANIQSKEIV